MRNEVIIREANKAIKKQAPQKKEDRCGRKGGNLIRSIGVEKLKSKVKESENGDDQSEERERERERERIFIKINRNNDTIIIQCMDYTD